MLALKLLCPLLLLGLVVAAPSDTAPERQKRQLFDSDKDEKKLDLEHNIPLAYLEKSLEMNDGHGDNEVNGTKQIDDKQVEYYHQKHKGTVKTIVEEKDQDDNKMENVFYHLSYEKQDQRSTVDQVYEETTQDTTDQTLADDEEEEDEADQTTGPAVAMDYFNFNNGPDTPRDAPAPAEGKSDSKEVPSYDPADNAGWFNNWFNWLGQTIDSDNVTPAPTVEPQTDAPARDLPNTPHLDQAIGGYQSFTILSPFYFGSIGLKSPECPPHRPTQVSIYFFSFCV